MVGLKTGPANFFFFYHALNPSLRSVYLAKLRQRFLTFFNVFESRITGENCTTGDPSNYVKSRAFSADYRTRIHEEKAFPSAIREILSRSAIRGIYIPLYLRALIKGPNISIQFEIKHTAAISYSRFRPVFENPLAEHP